LGIPTDVKNTTIGQLDTGQHGDVGYSRELIERGYETLHTLVENSTDEDWLRYHTSNHAGQISLTLAKGR
jgi:hypothetical protein